MLQGLRIVKKRNNEREFDPAKYGMIFCPQCNGSGKGIANGKPADVCGACRGFGLIKRQDKSDLYSVPEQGNYNSVAARE